jgi:hypothetical protein
MTLKRTSSRSILQQTLALHGFKKDGANWFRRQQGTAHQAIFLQSSNGKLLPSLRIIFEDLKPSQLQDHLNTSIRNMDFYWHLEIRLARLFHPNGNPSLYTEWSLPAKNDLESDRNLKFEISNAVAAALEFFAEYPSWQVAVQKFETYRPSGISCFPIYEDLGIPIPIIGQTYK